MLLPPHALPRRRLPPHTLPPARRQDANYRRLLGDLHWAHDTPFATLLDYFPTPVAALRTCKSGVCVGVEPAVEAAAAAAHPDKWLTGGLYGCVQLATP